MPSSVFHRHGDWVIRLYKRTGEHQPTGVLVEFGRDRVERIRNVPRDTPQSQLVAWRNEALEAWRAVKASLEADGKQAS